MEISPLSYLQFANRGAALVDDIRQLLQRHAVGFAVFADLTADIDIDLVHTTCFLKISISFFLIGHAVY